MAAVTQAQYDKWVADEAAYDKTPAGKAKNAALRAAHPLPQAPKKTVMGSTQNSGWGTTATSASTLANALAKLGGSTGGIMGGVSGGSTGGTGGSGGSGGTGGTSPGGVAPVGQTTFTTTAAANPYQTEQLGRFDALMKQYQDELENGGYSPEAALEQAKKQTQYALDTAQSGMGQRGFGPSSGLLTSQRMKLLSGGAQAGNEAAANAANENVTRRGNLLSSMSGVLGQRGQTASDIAANQLGTNTAASNLATKLQELDIERNRTAAQSAQAQMAALISLLGYL